MEISLLHRKENIVLTAIDVLYEFGIQGLSTREIAKRQGISESTIFKHFKTKSELLIAILDYYSKYDTDIMTAVELKKIKSLDAIRFFIKHLSEYYENYPAITAVMHSYDSFIRDKELRHNIKLIYATRLNFLIQLVDEAKEMGDIRSYIDSTELADVIIGLVRSVCLRWKIYDYDFSLKDNILSTLDMILGAIKV